jgi:hypothetical protein
MSLKTIIREIGSEGQTITIKGSEEFVSKTQEALNHLDRSSIFARIASNLGRIEEGSHSGMEPWGNVPTFRVAQPTSSHSASWYAGAIAHDTCHSKLYRDAKLANNHNEPHAKTYTGEEAERICLDVQEKVLTEIGADKSLIDFVKGQKTKPVYQGEDVFSWKEHIKKTW